ncbi:MAG: DUF3303 family protein [Cyclobacteriaceae bacterium]
MTCLIIERFYPHRVKALYQRFEEGRLLPPGVRFINSWVDEKVEACYQLIENESQEPLLEWVSR